MRRIALYAVLAAAIITGAGVFLSFLFDGPTDRRSIVTSAVVAFIFQTLAFGAVALASRDHVMTGWGIGVLLRFLVLVGYAFLIVTTIGLAPAAALISLATFFFLCTLVEPLLLRA